LLSQHCKQVISHDCCDCEGGEDPFGSSLSLLAARDGLISPTDDSTEVALSCIGGRYEEVMIDVRRRRRPKVAAECVAKTKIWQTGAREMTVYRANILSPLNELFDGKH